MKRKNPYKKVSAERKREAKTNALNNKLISMYRNDDIQLRKRQAAYSILNCVFGSSVTTSKFDWCGYETDGVTVGKNKRKAVANHTKSYIRKMLVDIYPLLKKVKFAN